MKKIHQARGKRAVTGRPSRVRIVIADDHPLIREGVRTLLRQQRDFAVVGEAADGNEALALVRSLRPDVLLIDLAMPSLGGLDVLRQLGDLTGQVRAIVYTAAIRQGEVATALRAGARGIVLKDAATQILVSSIRAVMNGQYWLCRDVLTDLTQILGTSHPPNQANNFGLTPRQIEVVAHVVAGRSNKEIAARLAVSEETIKHHLTHIFERLRVSNRVELAVFAAGQGLVARS